MFLRLTRDPEIENSEGALGTTAGSWGGGHYCRVLGGGTLLQGPGGGGPFEGGTP